jgi:capsular polysaccharide export protein
MKVMFMPAPFYEGPVRHLYDIYEIYNRIGKIFTTVGIDCYYFCFESGLVPPGKRINETEAAALLPEIDLLFCWRGLHQKELPLIEQCRKQGTAIYFSEMGWFPQVSTLYFDRKGINYGSTITDWKYEPLTKEQEQELNAHLANYHQCIAKTTGIKKDDFVFVPFQVESDSQLWYYSPRFKKMQELVDYVSEYIPGRIIFKKHPKGTYGEIKIPSHCELVETGTTHDYLTQCRYCVTINSTVGLEAMTYMKPVVTLGQSFYGGKGAYIVNNDADMEAGIKWAEQGRVSVGIVRAFLHYLFSRQWHKTQLNNPDKVMSLVRDLCV